uniref:Integrase catalytic domain-containing protein n=1 Tax=Tanacetum cinerariifolium TaxID=118510 RepID=A0A699GWG8_TANCI|nr:hypothetical protein [Tanacetum cinerariifolium]
MEWYRNLRIVLFVEDKLPFVEKPIPAMPVPPAGQVLPSDVLNTHIAWVKASKEIACLMLMTMDPNIQKNLEHLEPRRIQKNQKKKSLKAPKRNQGKGKAKMGYAPMPAPPFAAKPMNPPTPKKDNLIKDVICHQCGKVCHWRRNCPIYLVELMKKKKLSQRASTSGIFTIELYSFPNTSWVYDKGCGTHICINTQGLEGSRKLKPGALSLYVSDGHRAVVKALGEFHYYNKRAKLNLDSALLWHWRLGHISKKRIKKLKHDGLIDSTDIKSFKKCVSCMSGKMARKPYSHQVERVKDLLGLIHTDVCGPFKIMSRQGANYFVTFIDDFSHYGYVYLLKHKYEVFETFKVSQKKVENQLGKTNKSLRYDHGCEYMSQELLDHLKEHGIIAYRTPPYMPQHNGYPKEIMGYSFYYPLKNKVFVARNAEFLENSLIAKESSRSLEDLKIIQEEDTHPSIDTNLLHEEDDQEIDEPQRDHDEPANYKAALLDLESDKWLNAMNMEMKSIRDNEV